MLYNQVPENLYFQPVFCDYNHGFAIFLSGYRAFRNFLSVKDSKYLFVIECHILMYYIAIKYNYLLFPPCKPL